MRGKILTVHQTHRTSMHIQVDLLSLNGLLRSGSCRTARRSVFCFVMDLFPAWCSLTNTYLQKLERPNAKVYLSLIISTKSPWLGRLDLLYNSFLEKAEFQDLLPRKWATHAADGPSSHQQPLPNVVESCAFLALDSLDEANVGFPSVLVTSTNMTLFENGHPLSDQESPKIMSVRKKRGKNHPISDTFRKFDYTAYLAFRLFLIQHNERTAHHNRKRKCKSTNPILHDKKKIRRPSKSPTTSLATLHSPRERRKKAARYWPGRPATIMGGGFQLHHQLPVHNRHLGSFFGQVVDLLHVST